MPKTPATPSFHDFAADPAVGRFLDLTINTYLVRWQPAEPIINKALSEIHDVPAAVNGFCRTALALGVPTVLTWCVEHPAFALRLLRLWAQSPYLGESLERHPGLLEFLVALPRQAWGEHFLAAGAESALHPLYAERGLSLLRRTKREAEFRLGLLDLEGLMTLEAVTDKITELADMVLQTTLTLCWRLLHERHTAKPPTKPPPLCIIAMGKHGGEELNYLSDVDLLFVHDPGKPVRFPGSLSREQGTTALCELFLQELGRATPEGWLWLADMRLRPEGNNGPLVMDVAATHQYYETDAAPWELLALSRGRVTAGDAQTGQAVLAIARERLPGWMRHPDVVADLVEQRYRMPEAQDPQSRNVKSGFGGIRDVEWAAFVLGAMAANTHPDAWPAQPVRHTLAALHKAGLLSRKEEHEMLVNYQWLRQVEHRIMLKAGQKTHSLPQEKAAQAEIAASLGLDLPAFHRELTKKRNRNRALYETLFPLPPGHVDHWVIEVIDSGKPTAELTDWLGPEAPAAAQALTTLRVRQSAGPQVNTLIHGALSDAAPFWLQDVADSGAPLQTLQRFHRFENLAGSRLAFWQMIGTQPQVRRALVHLAARSGWACRLLHTHPQWLSLLLQPPTPDFLAQLKSDLTLSPTSLERYTFALVSHHLLGTLNRREVTQGLSHAADLLVEQAMAAAKVKGVLAVAVGKWGQGALLPGSDLDFIFFSSTAKGLPAKNRQAAKLLSLLTDYTDEGALFEADARLRPYGTQGEMVLSLDEALSYYKETDLWEQLVLMSARGIGKAAAPVAQLRETVLGKVKLTEARLDGLRHILRRTFQEKNGTRPGKRLDIKHAPGGLFHLECVAMVTAVRQKRWKNGPLPALDLLEPTHPHLATAYDTLRKLQLSMRVAADLPVRTLTLGQEGMDAVAGAMGTTPAALLQQITDVLKDSAAGCADAGL